MTDASQNIHQAIHAVKSALALHGIGKDRRNADQKYSFRGVEDVINALSELFVAHRINVVPRIVHTESIARVTGKGTPMPSSFVDAEFDLVSVDDGSMVTFKACGEGSDMSDKGTNKAMSAAFKYAMTLGFVIPTQGVLDEGDATTPGMEREQSRNDQPQQGGAETMSQWLHRHAEAFASFTGPEHEKARVAIVDSSEYKDKKARVQQQSQEAWKKLHDAELAAGQRTDDVPF